MTQLSPRAFGRTYVLPVLVLFVIPGFGLWFSHHATGRLDAQVLAESLASIARDPAMDAAERAAATAFVRENAMSASCAAGAADRAGAPDWVGEICSDYAQFAWISAASNAALWLGLLSLLVTVACAALAFGSRKLQYPSFAFGFQTLRVTSALQVALQGVIAVFLSYWVTAIWFNVYVVKLIVVVGLLAVVAVALVVKAIFQRIPTRMAIEGVLLDEARAPALVAHVREMCSTLNTEPPTQILAGIDDNFFVTESPLLLGERELSGRTLYISLSLMRALERGEASAVLGHEMAHFSGGDTAVSRKLSPLLMRYTQYLHALAAGAISRPVLYLMVLYRSLFELALARDSRAREHEADAVAARLTSPSFVARALLRIGAYASYRARVENELFDRTSAAGSLAIADRVATGFASYVTTPNLGFDLHESRVPHPFDSHPPLRDRLAALSIAWSDEETRAVLAEATKSSWVDAIAGADATEKQLWADYEARFAAAHEESLAYRYLPSNDDERAHVEKYFPAITLALKDGSGAVHVDYRGIRAPDWERPVAFDEIAKCEVNERVFKKYLDLKLKDSGLFGGKQSIHIGALEAGPDALLQVFQRYWTRHQVAAATRDAAA